MSSIRDVAARAGVSLGTVSHVLNHPEIVAEPTRLRVERAIEELGFVRNGSARQLRAGQSQTIGLVVLDIANPFFTEVARGVEDAANEAGYVVILCNSDDSTAKERQYLRVLEEQRVQGMLITPVKSDPAYLERLARRGIALTLLDRPRQSRTLCSAAVDDTHGGRLAAEHLLAQGYRRLTFVHGPLSIKQCADRREGIAQALREANLDPTTTLGDLTLPAQNAAEGEAAAEELLAQLDLPAAVICANDLLALGLVRAFARRGVRMPQDVALVGYDDVEFASALAPALTSVRQPKYALGRAATGLLLDEIRAAADPTHPHRHQQILYQPELIVRASSVVSVVS